MCALKKAKYRSPRSLRQELMFPDPSSLTGVLEPRTAAPLSRFISSAQLGGNSSRQNWAPTALILLLPSKLNGYATSR